MAMNGSYSEDIDPSELEAMNGWPWFPFLSHTESLAREIELMRKIGVVPNSDLHEWMKSSPEAEKIYDSIRQRVLFGAHLSRTVKVQRKPQMLRNFKSIISGFNPVDPEWSEVFAFIAKSGQYEQAEIQVMDIKQIHFALLALRSDQDKPRSKKKTRQQVTRALTEKQQRAYELRHYDRFPFAQIGAILGCSDEGARQHFNAAKKKIDEIRSAARASGHSVDVLGGISLGEYESGTASSDL